MMRLFHLLILILFGLLSSCSICDNVNCENGGQCSLGVCDCPEGFGGEFCEKELICSTGVLECQNGSACKGTWCDCQDFYVGDSCEMVYGQQYVGEYYSEERCFGYYSYLSCPDSLDANEIRVSHITWGYEEFFGFTLQFENDSTGIFEIHPQRYYNSYNLDSATISGIGYFVDSSMIYNLKIDYYHLNEDDIDFMCDVKLTNRTDISKF